MAKKDSSAAPRVMGREDARAHLLARVDRDPCGCWNWRLSCQKDGYGFTIPLEESGTRLAHRASYQLFVRALTPEETLDHLCRNRRCANPAHLEPVPHRVNVLRGASPSAASAGRTHCINGHELTPENTWSGGGHPRDCRACHRERQAAYRARRRDSSQQNNPALQGEGK